MAIVTQQSVRTPAPGFSGQALKIAEARRLAAALNQAGLGYDPNAQVSGRVVPLNPLTAIINGLQQGYGAYKDTQADTQETELAKQKHQALIDALSGGKSPDLQTLAKSGLVEPELLVKALAAHTAARGHKQVVPLADGSYGAFDPETGGITALDQKSPVYSPESQYSIELAKQAPKGVTITDPEGRKFRTSQELANPGAFGIGQNQGASIPLQSLPQQNTVPANPPQVKQNNIGVLPPMNAVGSLLSVQDAMREINRLDSNGNPDDAETARRLRLRISNQHAPVAGHPVNENPVGGGIIKSPSLAEEQAIKANADIEKSRQVEEEKTRQELIRKKQEAQLKTNTAADKQTAILDAPYDGKSIEDWIDQEGGGGLKAMANSAAGFFGGTTDSSIATQTLKTIEGWLTSNVPRMEGPQSDADRLMYKEMAAQVGDPAVPAERKKAALKTLRDLVDAYKGMGEKSSAVDVGETHKTADGWTIKEMK